MRFLLFIFFLILSATTFSQDKKLPAEVVTSIQQRIEAGKNPSIVVGIIDADGPRYYSFGKTKEGGKAVNEHSIYEIGSISKTFTATLLADMVIKKEMSLDDPIEKYLPSSVHIPEYEGHHITLGNLSDHTSSLPRMPDNFTPADPSNPYADYTVEQLYSFLSSYRLQRPIGSEYEYSNLAVGLLGNILALHAGTTYENLMIKTIADPLQMNETRIVLTSKMQKDLAYGHDMGTQVPNWDLPTLAGAGAIRSSVYDILKFLSANMGLTPSLLQDAMALAHQIRHDKANGNSVGLGWHIAPGGELPVIWHNGATGGYQTFIGFNEETHTGVAVFTNSSEGIDDIGFHLLVPQMELRIVKPSIATRLKQHIEKNEPGTLMDLYQSVKATNADQYDFSENDVNALGYYYLNQKKIEPALSLFEINVKEYPTSANVYDSYGEALMKNGQTEPAIENYKKSLALNPGNSNAVDMLAKMGVVIEMDKVYVDDATLESYIGTYELVPGFDIIITKKDNQLWAQATGQAAYEIFPKSSSTFYYKVVVAQIDFSKNAEGKVDTLTLHQGGRDIPGKKKA